MDENTKVMYMTKAIAKMHEAFVQSKEQGLAAANKTMRLRHPSKEGVAVEVMAITPTIQYITAQLAPKLLNSSWRLIRAGLKIYIRNLGKREGMDNKAIADLTESLYEKCWRSKPKSRIEKNDMSTTSLRKKNIGQADFSEISRFIRKKERKWGEATIIWMYAGMLSGLRPNEWKGSKLITHNDKLTIKVKSAKNDELRGVGEYRYIDISGFRENEVIVIKKQVAFADAFLEMGQWESYYQGCRKTLYYANKRVFKYTRRTIQLYSSRHQFTADIKASDLPSTERSVLLGHNSTQTQSAWYGKRRNGSSNGRVPRNGEPDMEKDVRLTQEAKKEKRNISRGISLNKEKKKE